jgi:RNA polymerase sigma-70 factor (ECF subfamily)
VRDSSSFDAFYAGTRRRVTHQLYAMTGDLGEAQDVAQEAYARAWQRWSRVSSYEDPEAWVRTVAWRIAVSRWRKARNALSAHRRHRVSGIVPEPSVDTVALVAALRRLPESQRRAVVLFHLCDLSIEQIAGDTGAPVGTVKARLARGRTALAALLEDNPDHPSSSEGSHV